MTGIIALCFRKRERKEDKKSNALDSRPLSDNKIFTPNPKTVLSCSQPLLSFHPPYSIDAILLYSVVLIEWEHKLCPTVPRGSYSAWSEIKKGHLPRSVGQPSTQIELPLFTLLHSLCNHSIDRNSVRRIWNMRK